MRRLLLSSLAAVVAVVATAAVGAEDPIIVRKKEMDANGAAVWGVGRRILKGEIPFNPVIAASIFQTTNAVAYSFGDYFPEDSKTGHDTEALPAIWEDPAGFEAALAKFKQDTDAALAAKPQDLESFRAALAQVETNCESCHEKYREDN